jgi:hypothetical protein
MSQMSGHKNGHASKRTPHHTNYTQHQTFRDNRTGFHCKLLPKSGECDTILTITDHDCTKAVILVPCKEAMTTEEFLELYRERVFPYTGIPQKIISDRDVRFTSEMFKELCDQLAIKHNMSTAYHPQTDGQSERTNQSVETILRVFCNQAQDNWREWLPVVQYILNARPSATTKQTPYESMDGSGTTHASTSSPQQPRPIRRTQTTLLPSKETGA